MKTSVFLTLFLFVKSSLLCAQIETPLLKKEQVMDVALDSVVENISVSKAFGVVEVIDLRNDTSGVGYYSSTILSTTTKKIILKSGCCFAVNSWISEYLQLKNSSDTANSLFAVIRRLRVSEDMAPEISGNNLKGNPENGWQSGVALKIEYYCRQGKDYLPLYRFDSLLIFKEQFLKNAGNFITLSLIASLQKLKEINIEVFKKNGRKVTLSDILNRVTKIYQIPIFNDVIYKKGIYANFEEFKNNAPSTDSYEFKEGKLSDILYVKKDGKEYPERNAWGFCDGKNIYIYSADKFSQLVREGNTFTFRGMKSITRKVSHNLLKSSALNLVTNTGEKMTNFKMKLKYYQIDMETGEIY